jgi:hypothetical protein
MSSVGLLVPGSVNFPLAPAATATSPKPRFQTPDFMLRSIPYRARVEAKRAPAASYDSEPGVTASACVFGASAHLRGRR